MKGIKKEGKDFKLFNKTSSGASKLSLFIMGIILGISSSALFGYMCGNFNATGDYKYYDWLLFVAIFLLIFTGELIGIYFGAYEEYVLNKKNNKDIKEVEKKKEVKKEDKVVSKRVNNTNKKVSTSKNKKSTRTNNSKGKTSIK